MGARNILLVDDHYPSLRALARLLLRSGHYVREASTVAQACQLATEEAPAVLVTDLELTDGDGCDLFRRLATQFPSLCGIAISGYDSTSHKECCKQTGLQLLLVKPFHFEQLLTAIDACPTSPAAGAGQAEALENPAGATLARGGPDAVSAFAAARWGMPEAAPPKKHVKVLLAEDHAMVRQGLRSLLLDLPWVEVVGEAANGQGAVELAAALTPDLVLMDVSMPVLDGIEATRQINARGGKAPRVLALSAHDDPEVATAMLDAGAAGYALKDCGLEELAEALRSVSAGGHYVSRAVAEGLIWHRPGGAQGGRPKADGLASRERRVLQLLADGKSTKQVAADLHISPKTVETHRRNIMEKLGIDSLAGLTKYAVREGLTALRTDAYPLAM